MEVIYLDNAATTRPDAAATEKARAFLEDDFYNPSALYREGFAVHKQLESARRAVLNCLAPGGGYDLVFTASGSEADNQVLFSAGQRGNVVISGGEHAAVYNAARELERRGVQLRIAKLRPDGGVDAEDLLSLVDGQTSLVSVIHVNNETGAVNDVLSLARAVKKINARTLFHSDGVQAFGKIPFSLGAPIDFYTISSHKIGGVRGVAGLAFRKGAPLHPLIFGGGQENGLRSGTENMFAVMHFQAVCEAAAERLAENMRRVRSLNALVRERLDRGLFTVLSAEDASPYILSVSAPGLRGEVLMHMADDAGLIVGTGSACSSKSKASRVILACGAPDAVAEGVLRISFSAKSTEEEAARAAEILNRCGKELAERMHSSSCKK